MSTREFFIDRLHHEIPKFVRVLRALPGDQLHYKPHEKNTAAGALAWQIATEMGSLQELFRTGDINYTQGPAPATVEEIADAFERNAQQTVADAQAASDERFEGPGRLLFGGHVSWAAPVWDIAWGFLFDMVHHRGQLTTYIRPMGGKVPAVYGPSADDAGA
jgi:uncharacterized damage-inducible protein DinB